MHDLRDILTKFEGSGHMGRLPTNLIKIGQFLDIRHSELKLDNFCFLTIGGEYNHENKV